jgi:hypothetical protein
MKSPASSQDLLALIKTHHLQRHKENMNRMNTGKSEAAANLAAGAPARNAGEAREGRHRKTRASGRAEGGCSPRGAPGVAESERAHPGPGRTGRPKRRSRHGN